ncbi:MAG: hypothetical protein SFV22_05705 [Saprospiraceae bacterium]|nr:hypothetical protein [Saprospiraceae bacterium]
MSLPASRLQRVLDEPAVEFRLGDYISRGFKFMNENAGLLIAFMLVSGVINFFAQMMPFIGFVISILLGPVLQIGYSQYAYTAVRERKAEFAEFFKGFSKMGPLVITYILSGLIGLVSALPGLLLWYQAGMLDWVMVLIEDYPFMEDVPPLGEMVDMSLFWLGVLLMFVGAVVISILFSWALQIVWFFDVDPMTALGASRKLIARNWGIFILFFIISGLIAASGALLCLVGLLYTAPAMVTAQFFAFADNVKLLEDEGEKPMDLTDHFIA